MQHRKAAYDHTVVELFELQAKKTPNNIALIDNKLKYTYKELNEKANQFARCLINKNVQQGDFVGILLEPSADFIVLILAINKIGAAYLPIDTNAPQSRLNEIIEDAKPILIITNEEFLIKLNDAESTKYLIKHVNLESISHPNENLNRVVSPNSPLYMMYTSGSTGKPKGVIISHCSVVNLVKVDNYANIKLDQIVAQFSNLAFDGSTFEIWSAFLNGAILVVIPLSARFNHNELKNILQKNTVECLFLPTGFFHQLIKSAPHTLDSVKIVVFGGEQANNILLKSFLNFRKNQQIPITLINGYGPTEATTFTCKHVMTECSTLNDEQLVSIGSAISNVKTFILDENHNEVLEGELYISGINLALGYHNSIQNQEKFIQNMHNNNESLYRQLYKTGDKVRKLSSGELLCLGRLDDQVKIGGFRIHLNEIEQKLMKHPDIAIAAVTVEIGGGSHQILTAYLVFSAKKNYTHADDIRAFLSSSLPTYMIPTKYVMVDELPLTLVGKVDKKNLNKIPHTDLSFHIDTSSTSSIEETIKNVWQHLLNRQSVETHKNLFELGANSLLITEACSMLNKVLQCELQISDMLAHPTIHKLSRYLEGDIGAPFTKSKKVIQSSDIAIIGMSCRFPSANNIDEFWENLCQGKDCLTRFDKKHINNTAALNKNFVPVKGILSDIDQFDASFFGFSPVDANITDPQQRIFLECTWEAMEHAGVAPAKDTSKIISVFAGMTDSTYLHENLLKNHWFCNEHDHFQQRIATSIGMLSTQVSYRLNLKGRSVNVNTACSTGLITVDQACQDLIMGQSDIALAGASSIVVPQINGYIYQQGSIVSPDGYCRPFSDNANGTVFSNGVGVVVLKRLADAIEDGDTIYAVIKSSSVNNDGLDKLGFTAPSLNGQISCIRGALDQANLNATDIGFVEAHGTATALGDVIEINALTSVYQEYSEQQKFCALGSVKANIGHTDVAAGIAGLIKTALCLYHKKIPPLIHFNAPNPNLMLDKSPFFVNKQLIDWEKIATHRYAGISAFGVGGTNIHMILSEHAHPQEINSPVLANEELILLSAKTEIALEHNTEKFFDYLKSPLHSNDHLSHIAYTLQTGREDFQWRRFVVGNNKEDIANTLFQNSTHFHDEDKHHEIIFMFSGQGTQYPHMAMQLFDKSPIFREIVQKGVEYSKKYLNIDLLDVICNTETDQLTHTEYTQPALFIIEYALAQLLIKIGITPESMIGHSIGEYVAACIAGVFSYEDAIALVCQRGQLMAKTEQGVMIALECTEAELQTYQQISHVDMALHNATHHYVLAGHIEEIKNIEKHLIEISKPFRRLKVSHAFHSSLMNSLEKSFKAIFSNITLSPPNIPIVSNVTGDWLSASDAVNPEYWYNHLRFSVQFCKGISLLLQDKHPFFLEVGMGQSLTSFVNEISSGKADVAHTLPNHLRQTSDLNQLHLAIGQLWTKGIAIDLSHLYSSQNKLTIALPTYSFQKQRYWIDENITKPLASAKPVMYRKTWSHHPVYMHETDISFASIKKHHWIIFKDKSGLSDHFISLLRKQGIEPIVVSFGSTYSENNGLNFEIDPNKKEDYLKFIHFMKKALKTSIILHCASYSSDNNQLLLSEEINTPLTCGFYSLLYLSQAYIEEIHDQTPLKIAVLTNKTQQITGTEMTDPITATLIGASQVIMQEHNLIKIKLFDLNHQEEPENHPQLLNTVIDTCMNEEWSEKNFILPYRNSHQWHLTYTELKLPKKSRINRLKDNGIYLLTGGLGGISLNCCEAIAKTVSHPTFILLSRSQLPLEKEWANILENTNHTHFSKIEQITKIKQLGATFIFYQVDINQKTQLDFVIQQCISSFGHINGLIHTAGLSHPELMLNKSKENIEQIFAPKIQGTYNLSRAMKNLQLDFVVLTSSLAALLGGVQYVDYAAANSGLDAVVTSGLFSFSSFVVSINWNTWRDVGIAASAALKGEHNFIGQGNDISPQEGQEIFLEILQGHDRQVAISNTDINTSMTIDELIDQNSSFLNKNIKISRKHTNVKTQYSPPNNDIEFKLIELWQNSLGIEDIGVEDNFFQLGGHSLKALNLIEKINHSFHCSLPITQIYSTPTIRQLSSTMLTSLNRKISSAIIPLKVSHEPMNVFLCHPISGLIDCFDSFVKQSNLPMSIYGLQDPSIDANTMLYKDFILMAEDYLQAIKKIQPQEPYHLIGYSFGGTLCYEIANMLRKKNEKISLLCLIDSWAINPTSLQNKNHFKNYLTSQHGELPHSLLDLAWNREQLLINHSLSKSNQKMLLFKASSISQDFECHNSPTNGWEQYNQGHIMSHLINASHETILNPSNSANMLYLIQEYLKKHSTDDLLSS